MPEPGPRGRENRAGFSSHTQTRKRSLEPPVLVRLHGSHYHANTRECGRAAVRPQRQHKRLSHASPSPPHPPFVRHEGFSVALGWLVVSCNYVHNVIALTRTRCLLTHTQNVHILRCPSAVVYVCIYRAPLAAHVSVYRARACAC